MSISDTRLSEDPRIASLTGVNRSDAGIASGLVNTSRQIGGAIGLAGVSAVSAA